MRRGAVANAIPGSDNRALRVCGLLNAERARYLVVGGVAANLHGSVRATRDVDILVPRDRANAERVLAALRQLPWGIAREIDADDLISKPFTIVGDDPRVDVLTLAAKVTFEAAWPRRRTRIIAGVRLPYLGLADLIRSKETGRASDVADLEVLRSLRPKRR